MFCNWTSDSSHQDYPITILKPIHLQQQITQETVEEQGIWYYDKLIIAIIKAINVNNVTHCMDNNYRLITIQEAGGMLIHIVPSYSLSGLLNKQKGKKNSIKIGVYNIHRPRPTPDNMHTLENTSLVMK